MAETLLQTGTAPSTPCASSPADVPASAVASTDAPTPDAHAAAQPGTPTGDAPDVSLRELVDAKLIIDEFLAEHEGELTPEIEALLRDNDEATKEKVESIAWFVKTEQARVAGIDTMIAQLQKRKRGIARRCDWLTDHYLREQLTRLGIEPGQGLKGTLSTVRFQYNNPKLAGEIDETTLTELYLAPDTQPYVRYTPESFALDKVPLLAALKGAHATVDGYADALATLADPAAKQKAKDKAQQIIDATTLADLERAQSLIDRFPQLTIVRDVAVRIA